MAITAGFYPASSGFESQASYQYILAYICVLKYVGGLSSGMTLRFDRRKVGSIPTPSANNERSK